MTDTIPAQAKVLFFGGSFDPIHHGHLIVARHAAEALGIGRIILMPGLRPPHKLDRELAPANLRLEMCRRAVERDPLFEVSDWELRQEGPSYTIQTISHFRRELPAEVELCWLIGMDALHDLASWRQISDLVEHCTFVTVGRLGQPPPSEVRLSPPLRPEQAVRVLKGVVAGPQIDISATEIRARVRAGRSIRYLTPPAVAALIEETGLYRD